MAMYFFASFEREERRVATPCRLESCSKERDVGGKSILSSSMVGLEACRGYPLPQLLRGEPGERDIKSTLEI